MVRSPLHCYTTHWVVSLWVVSLWVSVQVWIVGGLSVGGLSVGGPYRCGCVGGLSKSSPVPTWVTCSANRHRTRSPVERDTSSTTTTHGWLTSGWMTGSGSITRPTQVVPPPPAPRPHHSPRPPCGYTPRSAPSTFVVCFMHRCSHPVSV